MAHLKKRVCWLRRLSWPTCWWAPTIVRRGFEAQAWTRDWRSWTWRPTRSSTKTLSKRFDSADAKHFVLSQVLFSYYDMADIFDVMCCSLNLVSHSLRQRSSIYRVAPCIKSFFAITSFEFWPHSLPCRNRLVSHASVLLAQCLVICTIFWPRPFTDIAWSYNSLGLC